MPSKSDQLPLLNGTAGIPNHAVVHCSSRGHGQNGQSIYSPLTVPYTVLAAKQSVPVLCKSLKVRWLENSNPPFRTINTSSWRLRKAGRLALSSTNAHHTDHCHSHRHLFIFGRRGPPAKRKKRRHCSRFRRYGKPDCLWTARRSYSPFQSHHVVGRAFYGHVNHFIDRRGSPPRS